MSSAKGTLPSLVDDMMLPKRNEGLNFDETIGIPNNLSHESAEVSGGIELVNTSENKALDPKQTEEEEDLQGTVFISNLPFDIDNEEVKQRFSVFGEVQSFIPVLHRITKYAVLLTWDTSVLMPLQFVLIFLCL
jgi:nucleolar protein 4